MPHRQEMHFPLDILEGKDQALIKRRLFTYLTFEFRPINIGITKCSD